MGFPGGTIDKEPACQCRRHKRCRFDPWVGKIPWRRHGSPLQYSCLKLWTEEPGGLQSIGSHRVGHYWSNLACTHTQIPKNKQSTVDCCSWKHRMFNERILASLVFTAQTAKIKATAKKCPSPSFYLWPTYFIVKASEPRLALGGLVKWTTIILAITPHLIFQPSHLTVDSTLTHI